MRNKGSFNSTWESNWKLTCKVRIQLTSWSHAKKCDKTKKEEPEVLRSSRTMQSKIHIM